MRLVTDVSALVGQILDGEDARLAEAVLADVAEFGSVVPSIFWYEMRNVLIVNERRGRLTPEQSAFFLDALADMDFEVEPLPAQNPVLTCARTHNVSVYDASYLDLALRKCLPLATADRRLATAARNGGVRLFQA